MDKFFYCCRPDYQDDGQQLVTLSTEAPNPVDLSKSDSDWIWKALRKIGIKDVDLNVCEVFRRTLECEYDLLDVLRHEEVLTRDQHENIGQECLTNSGKTFQLLSYLKSKHRSKFLIALRKSNQSHLAKLLEHNGVRPTNGDKDWPLDDNIYKSLQKIYYYLVCDIDTGSILDVLYQDGCISLVQKQSIERRRTSRKKNRELIEVIMSRSIQQYETFSNALRKSHPVLENMLKTFSESKTDISLAQIEFGNTLDDSQQKQLSETFARRRRSNTDSKLETILRPLTDHNIRIQDIIIDEKVNVIFDTKAEGASDKLKSLTETKELDSLLANAFGHILKYDNLTPDDIPKTGSLRDQGDLSTEMSHGDEITTGKDSAVGETSISEEQSDDVATCLVPRAPGDGLSSSDQARADIESDQYNTHLGQQRKQTNKSILTVSVKLMDKNESEDYPDQGHGASIDEESEHENIGSSFPNIQLDYEAQEEALRTTSPKEILSLKLLAANCSELKNELQSSLEENQMLKAEQESNINIRNKISKENQQLRTENFELTNCVKEFEKETEKINAILSERQKHLDTISSEHGNDKATLASQAEEIRDLKQKLLTATIDCERSTEEVKIMRSQISNASCEKFLSRRCEVRIIKSSKPVYGITVLSGRIYVARNESSKINVYDSSTLKSVQADIKVEGLDKPAGLASTENPSNYLFISDRGSRCIHKVNINNGKPTFDRWDVKDSEPIGLSVSTVSKGLVVAVLNKDGSDTEGLIEYDFSGNILHVIKKLDSSIVYLHHAARLTNELFAVSHGWVEQDKTKSSRRSYHRVCIVDTKGKIVKSYGSYEGEGDGKLNEPFCFTVWI